MSMVDFRIALLTFILLLSIQGQAQQKYSGYFKASIMNDILFFPEQTDRYFSNGISLDFISPIIKKSPVRYIHIGYKKELPNVSGIKINQSLFTPEDLNSDSIVTGDRPYASYLLLENYHVFVNPERNIRVMSSFGLGVIGDAALGGFANYLSGRNRKRVDK